MYGKEQAILIRFEKYNKAVERLQVLFVTLL